MKKERLRKCQQYITLKSGRNFKRNGSSKITGNPIHLRQLEFNGELTFLNKRSDPEHEYGSGKISVGRIVFRTIFLCQTSSQRHS